MTEKPTTDIPRYDIPAKLALYDAALIFGLKRQSPILNVDHYLPHDNEMINQKYAELLNRLCIKKKDFNMFKYLSNSLLPLSEEAPSQISDIINFWSSLQEISRTEPMIRPSKFFNVHHEKE